MAEAPAEPLLWSDGSELLASKYRLIKPLGKGGMGEVFLAEHTTIEKRVAIKVLLEERAKQPNQKDRFLNEAKATARIRHPNVIDISDFGEMNNGLVYFVMEYLDGQDLKQLLRRKRLLRWKESVPILLQLCSALGAAHQAGVVHRDLKPDNVYLIEQHGTENFVKVLDFGLAKMIHEPAAKKLTKTGIIVGTPAFLSPEQVKGDKVDHRADVYAIGLIMYRMLSGKLPFKAKTVVEMLRKQLMEKPPPLTAAAPDAGIPAAAEEVVLRALCKDPDERYQNAEELGKAIAAAATTVTSEVVLPPMSPPAAEDLTGPIVPVRTPLPAIDRTSLEAADPFGVTSASIEGGPAVQPSTAVVQETGAGAGPDASGGGVDSAAAGEAPGVAAPPARATPPPTGPQPLAPGEKPPAQKPRLEVVVDAASVRADPSDAYRSQLLQTPDELETAPDKTRPDAPLPRSFLIGVIVVVIAIAVLVLVLVR